MAEESNVTPDNEKKSIISQAIDFMTKGYNMWIALGIVVVIAVVLLFVFGVFGGKVAATVNGEKIYLSEVDKEYEQYEKQFTANNKQKIKSDQQKQIKSLIVDRLIRDELVKQAAEDEDIKVSQKDVDKGVKQIKDSTSPEALKKGLKQMGWVEADLDEHVRNQLIQTKLREKKTKGIKITDKDTEKYYKENKANYKVPDQVKVKIAKVEKKSDADKMAKEAASDFDKAAKKYAKSGYDSQDLSKDQITGIYSKEFAEAAFKLNKGETTAVTKVQGGYAIAKVEGKTSAHQKTYKEVKEEIKTMLKAQKEQEAFDEFIDKFKKDSDVEILIDDLKPQQQQAPQGTTQGQTQEAAPEKK